MKNELFTDFDQAFSDKIFESASIKPIKLNFKWNQKPIAVTPPKQLEYHLEKPDQEHIQDLLKANIIRRVSEHPNFCSKAKFLQKSSGALI